MYDNPLTKKEVQDVIEGKGHARRVPMAIHSWVSSSDFSIEEDKFQDLLDKYPCDIDRVFLRMPEIFKAPKDDKNYRWSNFNKTFDNKTAIDSKIVIDDWNQLDEILNNFPSPNYINLIPQNKTIETNKYRVAHWWYLLFERFWSFRGMENALCDFIENPDEVHRLFRALTDFYKVAITRSKNELNADAVLSSHDIGTQSSSFFSLEIFREFFKPYYKELIDHAHGLNMHFWLHTCGNIEAFIPDFIEIGLDVLHPIQKYTMNECEIAEKYGDKICLWAGFDVQQVIPYGTADDVRRELRFMYDTYFRKDGRLIIAAGNNMSEDTPFESLNALLDEGINYGIAKCNQ